MYSTILTVRSVTRSLELHVKSRLHTLTNDVELKKHLPYDLPSLIQTQSAVYKTKLSEEYEFEQKNMASPLYVRLN